MDLNMKFSDFIKPKNENREEYQENIPQKRVVQQQIDEEYDEQYEDDDIEDYYQEPEEYYAPQQRVQPRPVVRPVRNSYRQIPTRNGYAMPESEFRRPLTVSPKQLKENTIEGTANSLTEAIKRKVDTVFYRFGIQGLEKLDEKILDTIEELQYPEQRQVKRPLREMRRQPIRKPVKKYKPLPLEEVPPIPEVYEEPILDEPSREYTPDENKGLESVSVQNKGYSEVVSNPIQKTSSPKPSFLQQKPIEKPKQLESTGDENEDMINAALSMNFNEPVEEKKPIVSDDEIWGEVEAILEAEPSQKLVHEPQAQSQLIVAPTPVEEITEENNKENIENTIENSVENTIIEEKPKRKRKTK